MLLRHWKKISAKELDTGEEQMRNNARLCWSTEEEAV